MGFVMVGDVAVRADAVQAVAPGAGGVGKRAEESCAGVRDDLDAMSRVVDDACSALGFLDDDGSLWPTLPQHIRAVMGERDEARERVRVLPKSAAVAHLDAHGVAYECAATLAGIRRAAGLSQTEVAERVGVTQPAIARAESRRLDALRVGDIRRHVEACGGVVEVVVTINGRREVMR